MHGGAGIADNAFVDLVKLASFSLWNNFLRRIGNQTLRGLTALRKFDLQYNLISVIEDNSFADLASLVHLDLSNNWIALLRGQTFLGLKNLYHLNLETNSITSVPTDAFHELTRLATLGLAKNHVDYIADTAFTQTPLKHITLAENPLACKCGTADDMEDYVLSSRNLSALPTLNCQYSKAEAGNMTCRCDSGALKDKLKLKESEVVDMRLLPPNTEAAACMTTVEIGERYYARMEVQAQWAKQKCIFTNVGTLETPNKCFGRDMTTTEPYAAGKQLILYPDAPSSQRHRRFNLAAKSFLAEVPKGKVLPVRNVERFQYDVALTSSLGDGTEGCTKAEFFVDCNSGIAQVMTSDCPASYNVSLTLTDYSKPASVRPCLTRYPLNSYTIRKLIHCEKHLGLLLLRLASMCSLRGTAVAPCHVPWINTHHC